MPIVACSDGSNTGLDLEAEFEALQQTCAVNKEVQSYHMDGSSSYIEGGKTLEFIVESEFVAPDRYRVKTYKDGGWEETIIIGRKVYSRSSNDNSWQEVEVSPNVLSAQKLNLEASIPSAEKTLQLLDLLTGLEKLPDEKIDGVDCLHFRGRVDMDRQVEKAKAEMEARLDPLEPEYKEKLESQEWMWDWQRQWEANYELWISREDCLIRQQRYETRIPAMESPAGEKIRGEIENTMLMHYHDINEPINIEMP